MNALFDKNFLDNLGVELSPDEINLLSQHYVHTLQERVLSEITTELDEAQLIELHELQQKSDKELREWITNNIPQLKEIIEDESAILLGEIAENSHKL
jgi:succinate dehydrogenase flavin-adding protein (antitoxin of CptAB toxin-antitoxin module)